VNGAPQAQAPYDLIMANILAGPLIDLAAPMTRLLAEGGGIILSGLMQHQERAVRRDTAPRVWYWSNASTMENGQRSFFSGRDGKPTLVRPDVNAVLAGHRVANIELGTGFRIECSNSWRSLGAGLAPCALR
jgi:hypothetical protein